MTRTAALAAALVLAACQQEAPPQPAADEAAPQLQPPATGLPGAEPVTNDVAVNDPAVTTPPPEEQASDDWRKYARPADVDRLKRLDAAWEEARATVSRGGVEALEKLGPVVDPKTPALANVHPAPGVYRCRTIKMGELGLIAYDWFRCRVELTPGGDLTFTKLTGSQRGAGKFYPSGESNRRLVYLGGQAWGLDEKAPTAYGADTQRDQIGVLERIGDQHWRLVLPWPRVESQLDVIEIKK